MFESQIFGEVQMDQVELSLPIPEEFFIVSQCNVLLQCVVQIHQKPILRQRNIGYKYPHGGWLHLSHEKATNTAESSELPPATAGRDITSASQ